MRALLLASFTLTACAVTPALEESQPAPPVAGQPVEPTPPAPVSVAEARALDLTGVFAQGGYGRGQVKGGAAASILLDGAPVPMTGDGRFFVAFDRDAGASITIEVLYTDGVKLARAFDIADTAFPESHLPPITQKIEASADFQQQRAEEIARITAARAGRTDVSGWQEGFVRPAQGKVSGVFGSQRFYGEEARSPHSGMDIAAPAGALVSSPASGRVVLAGGGYSFEGNLVIVDHGLGLFSAFLHLSRIDVREGDMLAKGQAIGAVGSSGRATGPHLHWGVWWNGVRFDPATLLEN